MLIMRNLLNTFEVIVSFCMASLQYFDNSTSQQAQPYDSVLHFLGKLLPSSLNKLSRPYFTHYISITSRCVAGHLVVLSCIS